MSDLAEITDSRPRFVRRSILSPHVKARVMRGILLLLGGLLWVVSAEAASGACKYFTASDTSAPHEVAEILGIPSSAAVMVCGSPEQPELASYYFASEASKGLLDVCYYTTQQVFRRLNSEDQIEWSYIPPDMPDYVYTRHAWMAQQEIGCPPHGDRRYVSVFNVSEGSFSRLSLFWQEITASIEAFEGFVGGLPFDITEMQHFADFEEETKAAIRSGRAPALVRVSISLGGSGIPYYEIHTGSPELHWILVVDFAGDGTGRIEVRGIGVGVV